jgi:hypothetical protein
LPVEPKIRQVVFVQHDAKTIRRLDEEDIGLDDTVAVDGISLARQRVQVSNQRDRDLDVMGGAVEGRRERGEIAPLERIPVFEDDLPGDALVDYLDTERVSAWDRQLAGATATATAPVAPGEAPAPAGLAESVRS